jgi:T5SS/PEP-CTERM-associated repeat protein
LAFVLYLQDRQTRPVSANSPVDPAQLRPQTPGFCMLPKSTKKFHPTLPTVTGMLMGLASPSLWASCSGPPDILIDNGSVFNIGSDQTISNCSYTVTGTGSQWNVGGNLTAGNVSTGTLNILNGGAVSNSSGNVGWSGGTGTVTVDGAGSSWTNSGNIYVGYSTGSNGTLNIQNGGTVSSSSSNVGWSGSTGTVTVDGAGSSWTISGYFGIGEQNGNGTLNILNGGAVSSGNGVIGNNYGTGTVTVDGAGSSWTTSGDLYVSYSGGNGTLNILNGGAVSNTTGFVGYGGTGTATVDGAGSSWTNSGTLYIGRNTNGTLNILNGGRVSSTYVALGYAGSTGTLNLSGSAASRGVLQTGYISKDTGTATFNWNGGILRATGNQSNYLQSFGAGSITVGSNGAFFDTNGYNVGFNTASMLTGSGGLTKQGAGTLSITGGNSYSGSTTVSAGTLQFGSYTQSAGQTLTVAASSNSSYGKLAVTGTATFNAGANLAVDVASVNTLAVGQTLTNVVTAGTLNASTFSVTDNSALFNFEASLSGSALNLNVVSNSSSGILDAVLAQGLYPAQGAAKVLDTQVNGSPTGDMGTVVTAFGTLGTNSTVARAAGQTLPLQSGLSSLRGVLGSFNQVVRSQQGSGPNVASAPAEVLYASAGGPGELPSVSPQPNGQAWARAFGAQADQADHLGTSGFSANTSGMAFGGDMPWGVDQRLGLAYAYANTQLSGNKGLTGTAQNTGLQTHVLALYGARALGERLALNWQSDLGLSRNESARGINFGGLARTASAEYDSYSAHAGVELARQMNLGQHTTFTPALRADYTWLGSQAYNETGAGALNLQVQEQTAQALVLGTDLSFTHRLRSNARLSGYVGVFFDTINERNRLVAAYAGAPTQVFSTESSEFSPWIGRAGVAYAYAVSNATDISVHYDIEARGPLLNQSAAVKAKWAF